MIDAVGFDLDGTLWDACAATAAAWTRAADLHGTGRRIEVADIEAVCGLVFDECVDELFPDVDPARREALFRDLSRCEREGITEHGGAVYEGVVEGLERLAARGRVFILSNCDRWYLDVFFRQTGLEPLFADTLCHGDTGLSKAENLALLRERHGWRAPVYVGDTAGDQSAAREASFGYLHVDYGFGDAPGAHTFPRFDDVCEHLLQRMA